MHGSKIILILIGNIPHRRVDKLAYFQPPFQVLYQESIDHNSSGHFKAKKNLENRHFKRIGGI